MRGLAKVRRSSGTMGLVGRQKPKPGTGEVLVGVDYAGLCEGDVGAYEFGSAFERAGLPTVIGHEHAGRVAEVSDGVTRLGVGDRVVRRPIRGCDECYRCRIGEEDVCQDAVITGADHDGTYERFITVPERTLHPIPDDVKQQYTAAAEPTGIAACAVIENSRVDAGDRVLVEGPGSTDLFMAQVAGVQGGTVVVSGAGQDADHRLPLAEELGFEAVNVADDDIETCHERHTDGVGYGVVFDTTGHPSGLTTAVDEVHKGSQIVLVGQTGKASVPYSPLVRIEINPQRSYASIYEDFECSSQLIRGGDVDYGTFVDIWFSLFEADETFETFIEGGTYKPVFGISEPVQGERSTAIQTG